MSDMQQRKVIARGYYQPPGGGWRVFEPGDDIHVPASFKARWLEPSGYEDEKPKAKPRAKPKAVKPEVATETGESNDDTG